MLEVCVRPAQNKSQIWPLAAPLLLLVAQIIMNLAHTVSAYHNDSYLLTIWQSRADLKQMNCQVMKSTFPVHNAFLCEITYKLYIPF